jgi:hypothetical protein
MRDPAKDSSIETYADGELRNSRKKRNTNQSRHTNTYNGASMQASNRERELCNLPSYLHIGRTP